MTAFLIGIRKSELKKLDPDRDVKISIKDIKPENAIIVRADSIDKEFNKNVIVSDDPQTILSANKIFFPGVGAFKKVMEYIEKKKLNGF